MASASETNGNGRKAVQYVIAIIGTVLVSIVGAFFAFGQQQSAAITKIEANEAEGARQRQIDQATIQALAAANRTFAAAVARLESRVAVLEALLDQQQQP